MAYSRLLTGAKLTGPTQVGWRRWNWPGVRIFDSLLLLRTMMAALVALAAGVKQLMMTH